MYTAEWSVPIDLGLRDSGSATRMPISDGGGTRRRAGRWRRGDDRALACWGIWRTSCEPGHIRRRILVRFILAGEKEGYNYPVFPGWAERKRSDPVMDTLLPLIHHRSHRFRYKYLEKGKGDQRAVWREEKQEGIQVNTRFWSIDKTNPTQTHLLKPA
jgi:hypothetical protein